VKHFFVWISLLLIPFNLGAGGLFIYEIAAPNVRLGSAGWAARASDPSTAFSNPAGMTLLDCETMQFGIEPIYAHVNFTPNSITDVIGEAGEASTWLPAGGFYVTARLNDRCTMGFASTGYWGAGLNYGRSWVGRYYVTETLLEGISAVPSIAFQCSENFSIGLGANLMYAMFLSKAAVNNALDALPDGYVRMLDFRFGAGAIIGGLYQFSSETRAGIQYMSPVTLRFRDKPKLHEVGPTLEAILALSGLLGSSTHVTIELPNSVIGSLYHEVVPGVAIMADLGWQQWSNFGHAEISLVTPASESLAVKGSFRDTWHAAFGMEYRYAPDLLMSAGFAYDSSMVAARSRTFSLPVGQQWRFGTGVQHRYAGVLIDLGYALMWSGNLPADQNRGILGGHVAGQYTNTCFQFINLSLTYAF
jgi:long-chain fatty acid transport protein